MIAELHCNYDEDKATFKLYNAIDAALKKQILDTTNETYITSLKDLSQRPHNRIEIVTTHHIIKHLYTNYRCITDKTLTENEIKNEATVGHHHSH